MDATRFEVAAQFVRATLSLRQCRGDGHRLDCTGICDHQPGERQREVKTGPHGFDAICIAYIASRLHGMPNKSEHAGPITSPVLAVRESVINSVTLRDRTEIGHAACSDQHFDLGALQACISIAKCASDRLEFGLRKQLLHSAAASSASGPADGGDAQSGNFPRSANSARTRPSSTSGKSRAMIRQRASS